MILVGEILLIPWKYGPWPQVIPETCVWDGNGTGISGSWALTCELEEGKKKKTQHVALDPKNKFQSCGMITSQIANSCKLADLTLKGPNCLAGACCSRRNLVLWSYCFNCVCGEEHALLVIRSSLLVFQINVCLLCSSTWVSGKGYLWQTDVVVKENLEACPSLLRCRC